MLWRCSESFKHSNVIQFTISTRTHFVCRSRSRSPPSSLDTISLRRPLSLFFFSLSLHPFPTHTHTHSSARWPTNDVLHSRNAPGLYFGGEKLSFSCSRMLMDISRIDWAMSSAVAWEWKSNEAKGVSSWPPPLRSSCSAPPVKPRAYVGGQVNVVVVVDAAVAASKHGRDGHGGAACQVCGAKEDRGEGARRNGARTVGTTGRCTTGSRVPAERSARQPS